MVLTDLSELRFFQTAAHPCGYLPDRNSSNVFVDPSQTIDAGTFSFLSSCGFRRSGAHIYKPRCSSCEACMPLRVMTDQFIPSRRHRRCLNKNQDLKPELISDIRNDECYALYEKYITERHHDGDMYPPNYEQFEEFLSAQWGVTRYLGFRNANGKLISVAVVDCLHNGLSAMYSFFDPSEDKRSLGVFNILYQILWAQDQQLPFLYLGYLIEDCAKMQYKNQYRPYQILKESQWVTVE